MRIKGFPPFSDCCFDLCFGHVVMFYLLVLVYAPRSRLLVCTVSASDALEAAMYVDLTLCHNTWVDCRELHDDSILHRVLTINVQDEWTEMCKRNVRDVMIVRHESENKK